PFESAPAAPSAPQQQAPPNEIERFATAFATSAPAVAAPQAAAPSSAPAAPRSQMPPAPQSTALPAPPAAPPAATPAPPQPPQPPGASPFSPSAGVPARLPEAERVRHEKARRLARVLASDIAIYNKEKRERGIQEGNLVAVLGYEIKKSWEVYKERVTPELANATPYFRDALNDMLAEGKKVF
ncbi:MAG TPA: hypothetical protein VE402_06605, partial [Candidatus Angelobacter sp.]|nr:hypothetical protein [Candidatus Angelobacter sp.]